MHLILSVLLPGIHEYHLLQPRTMLPDLKYLRCLSWEEVPAALKNYVEYIEKETGVPVTIVSVGPDRSATIYR